MTAVKVGFGKRLLGRCQMQSLCGRTIRTMIRSRVSRADMLMPSGKFLQPVLPSQPHAFSQVHYLLCMQLLRKLALGRDTKPVIRVKYILCANESVCIVAQCKADSLVHPALATCQRLSTACHQGSTACADPAGFEHMPAHFCMTAAGCPRCF